MTTLSSVFKHLNDQSEDAAVIVAGATYSYRAIDRLSNCLAQEIHQQLVLRNPKLPEVLPFYGERSLEYILTVLACWKLGIGVVPIASTTPDARLRSILNDLNASFLLLGLNVSTSIAGVALHTCCVDTLDSQKDSDLEDKPLDIAYLIYTSGTSGQPKGCVIGFESFLPILESFVEYYEISSRERVTFTANIAFDAAMLEWVPALLKGAVVYILDNEVMMNIQSLSRFYKRNAITFSWLPTPVAEILMVDSHCELASSLRMIQTAGQRLTIRPPASWHTIVENAYGPTETTIIATSSKVEISGLSAPDIGVPLNGVECFVLDENLKPVKDEEIGQLHIGGIGLSRGYYKQPQLTAEKFIQWKHSPQEEIKLYVTGDLCRWNAQGRLEYIGRTDDQVKLHGHRIEISEIILRLSEIHGVKQAFCNFQNYDNQDYLVAYVITEDALGIDSIKIKQSLAEFLPTYMIPSQIYALDHFALTPNGKIDENCLPGLSFEKPDGQGPVLDPELSPKESGFLTIIQHHIGKHVGWDSDFFSAGGNSISAITVASEVHRKLSLVLPFSIVDEKRTPRLIWKALSECTYEEYSIASVNDNHESDAKFPLSSSQRSVLFLSSLNRNDRAYHAKAFLRMEGDVNPDAVRFALQIVVERHSVFRTSFSQADQLQTVHSQYQTELAYLDLSEGDLESAESRLSVLINTDLNLPFDITRLPLVRWTLVKLSEQQFVLVHIEHHLVHDGWSYNLFLSEFEHYYNRFYQKTPSDRKYPPQYVDYCVAQNAWLDSPASDQQLEYWKNHLRGATPTLGLPTNLAGDVSDIEGQTIRVQMNRQKWNAIERLAKARGETSFSIVLGVFNIILSRYSGQRDICVGSAFANRNWINADEIIGMMINTVVLRTKLWPDMTIDELLSDCFATVSGAQQNQALPFEYLVKNLDINSDPKVNPLFQVFLGFHDSPMPEIELNGVEKYSVFEAIDSSASKFDLSLVCITRKGQDGEGDPIHMLWEFKTAKYSNWLINQMILEFQMVLDQVIDVQSSVLIGSLDKRASTISGPATDVELLTIYQRFQMQAERTPSAISIICDGQSFTYRGFLDSVNNKAQVLLSCGITPESRVGIHMQRGVDSCAWLLACQAVGACYIPMDPGYPIERIRYIAKHSRADLVIAECGDSFDCKVIDPSQIHAGALLELPRVDQNSAMYTIYTSGSTGLPKGVVVSHFAFSNFIRDMANRFPLDRDSNWLAFTSYSFDISTLELYLPLVQGATLTLVTERESRDLSVLHSLLDQQAISHCQATPSVWRSLVDIGWSPKPGLVLLCGGEHLDQQLAQSLLQNGCELYNLYGPTETTVWSMVKHLKKYSPDEVTLGLPISNTEIHLLDDQGCTVPPGSIGNVWISGDGLAEGYLFEESLTEKKFVYDSLLEKRRFFTGDLGSLNKFNEMVFHGRSDNQVKVSGHRIELGEIESIIRKNQMVKDAVVVVREHAGEYKLVAFVSGHSSSASDMQEAVEEVCAAFLPKYMMPNIVITLNELPKTPNNKIDRNGLPCPTEYFQVEAPPVTDTQKKVAGIFCEKLNLDKADIHTGFFQLGGKSLMAMKLAYEIQRKFDIPMTLSDFLELDSIYRISNYIEALQNENISDDIKEEFTL